MNMRVEIAKDACVGGGRFVPDVFDQRDEDGILVLLEDAPRAELHEAVREAAMLCPAAAIRVIE